MSNRGWDNLPFFSQALYKASYFKNNEDYEAWLHRVCSAYSNDANHYERMKTYFKQYWFHTSTPPSSNAGKDYALPIACYTKSIEDTKEGIFDHFHEISWLGALGGGVGDDWSLVRSINESVGGYGKSSGIIPFLVQEGTLSNAVSQGGHRRFSSAAYLRIDHPEIEEFIDIRKPTGDQNRRSKDLHHGVVITNKFMEALINDKSWDLISPKTGTVLKTVSAKDLWIKLLEVRSMVKGEPYLLFVDTVNSLAPQEYKDDKVTVTTSNLCSEITLDTSNNKTGVCCLSSVNLEYYDEWKHDEKFIPDCLDFLDNILQDFIDKTEDKYWFKNARNSAIDERSIGLGVMGLHSYFQSRMIPWESSIAKGLNSQIFSDIKEKCDRHNINVNTPCPMAKRTGSKKRNIHCTAIAPTMSISALCNVTSSGIEPWVANTYTKKVKQGSFKIRNKYLDALIKEKAINELWIEQQWQSISKHEGSVQHLDWLSDWEKDVFKTAFEIDQKWLIDFAGDRSPKIDQAQSLNLFIKGDSHVQTISDLHVKAWKVNIKSLYYLRSTAVSRAKTETNERKDIKTTMDDLTSDTCIGCG